MMPAVCFRTLVVVVVLGFLALAALVGTSAGDFHVPWLDSVLVPSITILATALLLLVAGVFKDREELEEKLPSCSIMKVLVALGFLVFAVPVLHLGFAVGCICLVLSLATAMATNKRRLAIVAVCDAVVCLFLCEVMRRAGAYEEGGVAQAILGAYAFLAVMMPLFLLTISASREPADPLILANLTWRVYALAASHAFCVSLASLMLLVSDNIDDTHDGFDQGFCIRDLSTSPLAGILWILREPTLLEEVDGLNPEGQGCVEVTTQPPEPPEITADGSLFIISLLALAGYVSLVVGAFSLCVLPEVKVKKSMRFRRSSSIVVPEDLDVPEPMPAGSKDGVAGGRGQRRVSVDIRSEISEETVVYVPGLRPEHGLVMQVMLSICNVLRRHLAPISIAILGAGGAVGLIVFLVNQGDAQAADGSRLLQWQLADGQPPVLRMPPPPSRPLQRPIRLQPLRLPFSPPRVEAKEPGAVLTMPGRRLNDTSCLGQCTADVLGWNATTESCQLAVCQNCEECWPPCEDSGPPPAPFNRTSHSSAVSWATLPAEQVAATWCELGMWAPLMLFTALYFCRCYAASLTLALTGEFAQRALEEANRQKAKAAARQKKKPKPKPKPPTIQLAMKFSPEDEFPAVAWELEDTRVFDV